MGVTGFESEHGEGSAIEGQLVLQWHPNIDREMEVGDGVKENPNIRTYIHPLGPFSVQSFGSAYAVTWVIGHNPGRVATPTQETNKLALILPTSEG